MSSISHYVSAIERKLSQIMVESESKVPDKLKILSLRDEINSLRQTVKKKINVEGLNRVEISYYKDNKIKKDIFFCIANSPIELDIAIKTYCKENSIHNRLSYSSIEVPTMKRLN